MQTSAALGSITMEAAVSDLLRQGVITPDVAQKAAGTPTASVSGTQASGMMGMFSRSSGGRNRI
jgi:Tfp pilus assembly pilus retraction ATPase PilT